MPDDSRIIAAARSEMDDDGYREFAREAIAEFGKKSADNKKALKGFLKQLHYVPVDAKGEGGWESLKSLLRDDENVVRAFYFSVGPSLFADLAKQVRSHELSTRES